MHTEHTSQLLFKILDAGRGAILVNPICGLLNSGEKCLLIFIIDLASETLLVTELVLDTIDER
jgi:hypothetical protein